MQPSGRRTRPGRPGWSRRGPGPHRRTSIRSPLLGTPQFITGLVISGEQLSLMLLECRTAIVRVMNLEGARLPIGDEGEALTSRMQSICVKDEPIGELVAYNVNKLSEAD